MSARRGNTLEPRLYSRLLVRLLALPIAALTVLALILGYGLQRVQESASSATTEREVLGSAGEIRQILSNLVANSLDACTSGSIIRIEANSAVDPRDPSRPGVRITIADTGFGIPPQHLENIFEPFFTAKKIPALVWASGSHANSSRSTAAACAFAPAPPEPPCGTVFSIFLPNQGSLQTIDSLSTNDQAETRPNGAQQPASGDA